MHLAVLAANLAVGVEHDGRVVIETRRSALEHARHDHYAVGTRGFGIEISELARNLLGEPEVVNVFCLTEIERIMQLGEHHELSAFAGKTLYGGEVAGAVGIYIRPERMLDYSDFHIVVLIGLRFKIIKYRPDMQHPATIEARHIQRMRRRSR